MPGKNKPASVNFYFCKSKMKRFITIFVAIIYALSTTGFAVKADYCCEKLESVKLVLAEGVKDQDGCCKVKFQSLKVNDSHVATDMVAVPLAPFTFIIADFPNYFVNNIFNLSNTAANILHAPPLIASVPGYISHCVFRI